MRGKIIDAGHDTSRDNAEMRCCRSRTISMRLAFSETKQHLNTALGGNESLRIVPLYQGIE